jgi:hypothetical protein
MSKITHKQLVELAAKWLKKHKENIVIPNCPIVSSETACVSASGEIADVIGWCYWTSVLIEVKVSKNDFKNDKKKRFKILHESGMGELRYYCCPKGLIAVSDLPENWGLLEICEKNKITIVKKAERCNSNLISERSLLLSIIRRQLITIEKLNKYIDYSLIEGL